jgi:hypothetical protein
VFEFLSKAHTFVSPFHLLYTKKEVERTCDIKRNCGYLVNGVNSSAQVTSRDLPKINDVSVRHGKKGRERLTEQSIWEAVKLNNRALLKENGGIVPGVC